MLLELDATPKLFFSRSTSHWRPSWTHLSLISIHSFKGRLTEEIDVKMEKLEKTAILPAAPILCVNLLGQWETGSLIFVYALGGIQGLMQPQKIVLALY